MSSDLGLGEGGVPSRESTIWNAEEIQKVGSTSVCKVVKYPQAVYMVTHVPYLNLGTILRILVVIE